MGKLKDIEVFGQEKGAIAKFFIILGFFAALIFADGIVTSRINNEPVNWTSGLLVIFILAAVVSLVYFFTRFLAYRTKIFPKTENREGVHGVSFIFLLILSFVLLLVFI